MKTFISKYKVIPVNSVIGATSTHVVDNKFEGNFSLYTERNWTGIPLNSILRTDTIDKVASDTQFIKEFTFTNDSSDAETFSITLSYLNNSQKFNKTIKHKTIGAKTPTQIADKLRDLINITTPDFTATSAAGVLTVTLRYDVIDNNPTVISGTDSKTTTITENVLSYADQQSDIEELSKSYDNINLSDFDVTSKYNVFMIQYDVLTDTVHGHTVEKEYAAFFIEESVSFLSLVEAVQSGSSYEAVNLGLSADGTNSNTTLVLEYGINVVTTASLYDYACKLPQPILGKTVKVVNKSNHTIALYPSNVGGQINNYPVDRPALIPPNGIAYDFACIENPLPGAWTWSPPSTAQYDSGEISVNITAATSNFAFDNPIISAVDTNNVAIGLGPNVGFESYSWGYDGRNLANVFASGYPAYFRTDEVWKSINKIKIYTNAVDGFNFQLSNGSQKTWYANANTPFRTDGEFLNASNSFSGAVQTINIFSKTIGGTVTNPADLCQPNIGDPGTVYYEVDTVMGIPLVGQEESGAVTFPFTYPSGLQGEECESNTSGFISFQIKPFPYQNYGTVNFKFRFIIEYTV